MQRDEIPHEREADAGPLMGPGDGVFDAMEPVEDARQVILGDADARISDDELDATGEPTAGA